MKRMVELYKYKSNPYPRSTDFLRILREAVDPYSIWVDRDDKDNVAEVESTEVRGQ